MTESGAAEYRIPIRVPPGIGGMEPKLALVYNSQSGNGLLGVGWNLEGLSTITRCPRTMAQDGVRGGVNYDSNDRYCLDGQRLMAISGTYGAHGTEYRTERESFSRIISFGQAGSGPAWFKVWTKSGQVIEYGNTTDSRVEAQGATSVRAWAVSKVSDAKGNHLTASYMEDNANGGHYPERIDYAGASVRFAYEGRPDISSAYRAGSVSRVLHRLTRVRTYHGETLTRDYRLAYEQSATTTRTRLTGVGECLANDACLPATTLAWRPATGGWTSTNAYAPPGAIANEGRDAGVRFIDLNGDGRIDMVHQAHWNGPWEPQGAWLNNGNGWTSAPQYVPPAAITNEGRDAGVRFIDLNGDGLVDMVWQAYWNGPWAPQGAWLNNGNGWTSAPQYIPPAAITNEGRDAGVRFVDLNGDGLVDMVWQAYWNGPWAPQGAWLNNGNGWTWAPQYIPPAAITNEGRDAGVRFIDLNGDGLVDMVWQAYWNGPWAPQGAWLNSGDGWTWAPQYIPPAAITNEGRDAGVRFVDLNGDGLVDMVWQAYWNGPWAPQGAWLNNGNGWTSAPQYIPPAAITNEGRDAGVRFVDLNGDGLVDMVWQAYWNGPWAPQGAWLNNGNGWTSAPQYIPPAAITNEARDAGVRFEDINGDGVLDIVWHAAWAGPWNPVAAWTNSGGAPDLLASVTSGLGATTSVTYKPLTDAALYTKDPVSAFPLVSIQPALHAVSALDASDGRGGSITTSYAYGGLKAEAGTGRGELGFRWQESTQQASGLKVRTEHRQDWPYVGLPSLVKRTQGSSAVLSQTLNAYGSTHPAAGVYFPFLSQSVETSNDLNGAPLPTVTVNTSYDANGNPTSVTLSTGDGHSKTTTNIFDNDRLKRSTVQSTSP